MNLDRREFIGLAAGATASLLAPKLSAAAAPARGRFKAVAFDAFPILDPRPVFALVETHYPGHGKALSDAWKTRQFEYTWLRSLMGNYVDFLTVTRDALTFAAESLKLELPVDTRDLLMASYLKLKAWPDVPAVLEKLRNRGLRLGFLSNFTSGMLEAGISNSGLAGTFEQILSTDLARTFKPDPKAYELGPQRFGLDRQEILFVAFAGWDAAGAKRFGFPTYWVNRLGAPLEKLDVAPDGTGRDLSELEAWIAASDG